MGGRKRLSVKSMGDNFADSFINNTIVKREKDIRVIDIMIDDLMRQRNNITLELLELREIVGEKYE